MGQYSPVPEEIKATWNDKAYWYKDAVIYEVHVRAFCDSNGDGIGDFKGLISRIDYLVDLGVNVIWLLPFYPSPQKDDGYDISDYTDIHPLYGTIQDFRLFLNEAHQRGLRVITELVLNHTSDQHEWFQKSRTAGIGDPMRDFYVWSEDPQKYKGTRIIFKDYEVSNWTWDPVAKSYYWHRFYSHQPDLNFDNPTVIKKMFEVVDFWFKLGVDGMRIDAVPYLIEREGTSSENLPETHALLKKLRQHIDQKFDNKMLLAEANQWPEDAVSYFGNGDECHMCFHFPLMPRLFMAIRMEDRFSIIDILNQTPNIPESCQWALFLRNHDELTLEMVTDEERDYMYNTYAEDPRAQINLGIRHRLAPLLQNDRRQIELLHILLFSMPGTPVIYYGDEIGMGDNIYLGDRNGVRTPFQWTPDRNAGFSIADPQKLFLPTIISPEFHYETINVENQQKNPNSLLWWMKKLISHRKRYLCLSRGSLEFISPRNTRVLSFVRRLGDEIMLIVVNLSRKSQYAELDLSDYAGIKPIEVFGRVHFPMISNLPYLITLGPYASYWFQLDVGKAMPAAVPSYLNIIISADSNPFYELRRPSQRAKFEDHLVNYLSSMRWFAGKSKEIEHVKLLDIYNLDDDHGDEGFWALGIVEVNFVDRTKDQYLLTLGYADGQKAQNLIENDRKSVIAHTIIRYEEQKQAVFFDAATDPKFFERILQIIIDPFKYKIGREGALFVRRTKDPYLFDMQHLPQASYRQFEHSNSCMVYGKELFLKMYRKLDFGQNPEIEICNHLSSRAFAQGPHLIASVDLIHKDKVFSVGILQRYIHSEKDAWQMTIDFLTQMCEQILVDKSTLSLNHLPQNQSLSEMFERDIPEGIGHYSAWYLSQIKLLSTALSNLHLSLGDFDNAEPFAPEELTPFYQRSMFQSLRNWTEKVMHTLGDMVPNANGNDIELYKSVLALKQRIYDRIEPLKKISIDSYRIRCHGDFHLGQVLSTGMNLIIVDFEGEPARSIKERKVKRSALRDVAGLMRSLDYAAHYVLKVHVRQEDRDKLSKFLSAWSRSMQAYFLKTYYEQMHKSGLVPENKKHFILLTECLLLEKVLYEIIYEADNRPQWIDIPLHGLLDLLS